MKKQHNVKASDCYVQAERAYNGDSHSDYLYSIYINGEFVICDALAEDLRNLAAAIYQALEETTEKGGGQ